MVTSSYIRQPNHSYHYAESMFRLHSDLTHGCVVAGELHSVWQNYPTRGLDNQYMVKTPLFFTVLRKIKCLAPWASHVRIAASHITSQKHNITQGTGYIIIAHSTLSSLPYYLLLVTLTHVQRYTHMHTQNDYHDPQL